MSAYLNEIRYGRATGIAITITPMCSTLTIKLTNITADNNEGCNGGNMNIMYRTFDPTNRLLLVIVVSSMDMHIPEVKVVE